MPLQLLIIFLFAQEVITELFQPVSSSCIYWESLSLYSHSETKKLHCILDENNQPGIVNVTWKWVESGMCPYFDRHVNVINVKPCDAELGKCPDKEIYSFQAVKYSACHNAQYRNETSVNKTNSNVQSPATSFTSIAIYDEIKYLRILFGFSLLSLGLIQLFLLGLSLHRIRERRQERRNGNKVSKRPRTGLEENVFLHCNRCLISEKNQN